MVATTTISKTDLARRTRQILEQARRGRTMIVESYGQEQVAILDALDYRMLRAVAAYYSQPSAPSPISDASIAPHGLAAEDVTQEADAQMRWNRVLGAYLAGDISLARAAELLELSRFELADRFHRLGVPLVASFGSVAEAASEFAALVK